MKQEERCLVVAQEGETVCLVDRETQVRRGEMMKSKPTADISQISGVPLYVRIREALREEIAGGGLKRGEKIPSEHRLAEDHNASRMTVRQAIRELIDEGLLYRRQGLGTFVAHSHINRDHTKLTDFFEEAQFMGMEAEVKILSKKEVPAEPKIAEALVLSEGEPVIRIRSLRFLNGEPVTIHCAYLPKKLFPDLLNRDGLINESFWVSLDGTQLRVKKAIQKLEAREASGTHARLLKMKRGSPVLYKERVVFTDDGVPVEYVECHSRGDKYSCTVLLSR